MEVLQPTRTFSGLIIIILFLFLLQIAQMPRI